MFDYHWYFLFFSEFLETEYIIFTFVTTKIKLALRKNRELELESRSTSLFILTNYHAV